LRLLVTSVHVVVIAIRSPSRHSACGGAALPIADRHAERHRWMAPSGNSIFQAVDVINRPTANPERFSPPVAKKIVAGDYKAVNWFGSCTRPALLYRFLQQANKEKED
jgi:hypothetical protein